MTLHRALVVSLLALHSCAESADEVLDLPGMVRIRQGSFLMGSTVKGGGFDGHCEPVHPVSITRPFWLGRCEVTQAEHQTVMGWIPGGQFPEERDPQLPVLANWYEAMAYCAALTAAEAAAGRVPAGYQYRLPTEAEWEYACRAGTKTEWNTGESLSTAQANFSNHSANKLAVVGSYAANSWGLFDMHGNLWEWCLDSYAFYGNYPASAVADPYCTEGEGRICRGGSWGGRDAMDCRSAIRYGDNPAQPNATIGFRVCLGPILVP